MGCEPNHEPAPPRARQSAAPTEKPIAREPASIGQAIGQAIGQDGDDVLISIRARPRAHAEGIEVENQSAWPLSVRAAAREGEANAALLALLRACPALPAEYLQPGARAPWA